MNDRHAHILVEDFPYLFSHLVTQSKDWRKDLPGYKFGDIFDCGDGWFELVYKMSTAIIDKADELIILHFDVAYPVINEVASFAGALFVNMTCSSTDLYDIVARYEEMSKTICEVCGKPGRAVVKSASLLRVRCDEHDLNR